MAQIVRSLRNGALHFVETPQLVPPAGHISTQTVASVISAGTERAVSKTANASLVGKARQQPERVKQVIDMASTQGVQAAYAGVQNKLGTELPLGYANCGRVRAVGPGVEGFRVGDLVANNGGHADQVIVPANLASLCPPGVTPPEGAFATLGAIALEGIRLMEVQIGSRVAVVGLGLIGQLASQLLLAAGCKVLGIDPDTSRRQLAESYGAVTKEPGQPAERYAAELTSGRGLDAVLVAASTSSSAPISSAAAMSRQRGRVILTGVTGLELNRADFYAKELTFQVSCSYGPGRYDRDYEDNNQDYPYGYVRFTASRNMEAFLDLLSQRRLDLDDLITHSFEFVDAEKAYDAVETDPTALAVVLNYPDEQSGSQDKPSSVRKFDSPPRTTSSASPRIAVIGSGSFSAGVLIPALVSAGGEIAAVSSRRGTDAGSLARKFQITTVTSDSETLLSDPSIDAVAIATRHDSHAELTGAAIAAGKAIWVEKPLAITLDELDELEAVIDKQDSEPNLLVGFNRRFAPISREMRARISDWHGPISIAITVNAGSLPVDHWTRDLQIGGGRIVGEMCHFVDLSRYLAGATIETSSAEAVRTPDGDLSAHVLVRFSNGSVATVLYIVDGSSRFQKERVEVFGSGRVLVNNNFRDLRVFGERSGIRRPGRSSQDKGHKQMATEFVASCRGASGPIIPLEEILEVSRMTIMAGDVVRNKALSSGYVS